MSGGGGGRIGTTLVAKAPPDGYTLRLGADVIKSTPEEFARRVQHDYAKWIRIRRETGIKLE